MRKKLHKNIYTKKNKKISYNFSDNKQNIITRDVVKEKSKGWDGRRKRQDVMATLILWNRRVVKCQ